MTASRCAGNCIRTRRICWPIKRFAPRLSRRRAAVTATNKKCSRSKLRARFSVARVSTAGLEPDGFADEKSILFRNGIRRSLIRRAFFLPEIEFLKQGFHRRVFTTVGKGLVRQRLGSGP